MAVEELPMIQVIEGPEEDGVRWFFGLNNRRLWVLKQLREDGLLPDGLVKVRVRGFKSDAEAGKYTVENCGLEAKFMREKQEGEETAWKRWTGAGAEIPMVEEMAAEMVMEVTEEGD
eukprot:TRINITY_DN6643_c0_g1_i2.p1 TRINITY_DN6643_c0_g1~~TRINITY_DN6643_c0_g1_i2.p1  ORF type:complete len:117 (+),score=43.47 TRINITY_DN6643_c0_g1_i2:221-571(+)